MSWRSAYIWCSLIIDIFFWSVLFAPAFGFGHWFASILAFSFLLLTGVGFTKRIDKWEQDAD